MHTRKMRAASSRVRVALGIAPLAMISAAATVHLAQTGPASTVPVATTAHTPRPPASSPFVRQPLAPASVVGAGLAASVAPTTIATVAQVAAVTAADIPYDALAAYQRAATVVGTADPTCHLDWALLAGIGHVASEHGRLPEAAGSAADTDAGQYDGDAAHDAAIGPLRLLPATWAAIGVDGDGDGQRDPRDVDDAALAAAVFLCAGEADLALPDAQRAAATAYDPTPGFADAVLAAAAAYRVVPPVTTIAPAAVLVRGVAFAPMTGAAAASATAQAAAGQPGKKRRGDHTAAAPLQPATPTSPATTTPPAANPTPTPEPTKDPTTEPTAEPPTEPSTEPSTEPTPPPPAPDLATKAELDTLCRDRLSEAYADATASALSAATEHCVTELDGRTLPEARDAVAEVVARVGKLVDGLAPAAPSPSAEGTGEPEAPAEGASESPATN